ncbi:putative pentapeptide [Helianthus anomalus]
MIWRCGCFIELHHKKIVIAPTKDLCTSASKSKCFYQNAKLRYANLEGANLEVANLEGAILVGANMSNANLKGANLQDAYRDGVDLHDVVTLVSCSVSYTSHKSFEIIGFLNARPLVKMLFSSDKLMYNYSKFFDYCTFVLII